MNRAPRPMITFLLVLIPLICAAALLAGNAPSVSQ